MIKKISLIVLVLFGISCSEQGDNATPIENRNYKQDMRDFVIHISQYAKNIRPDFAIIPQNGIELVTTDGTESGSPDLNYLNAIDGNGQEDLNFGYENDDMATSGAVTSYLKTFLDISKNSGNVILATDYCSTISKMKNSYDINTAFGYLSFAATQRNLNTIPSYPTPINNQNTANVIQLSEAKNFIFLINAENYATKTAFINAVKATNYDAIIMDLFFNDGTLFTASEIEAMKTKANGGKRIIISYMSIGEAEDYRYYWNSSWNSNHPDWLSALNPIGQAIIKCNTGILTGKKSFTETTILI